MPLYEYQCDACGHRFERICKFSDPPLTVCPQCDGAIRKLVSSPAIQFKGTGWYVTDYANKERSGSEASEAGQSSGDTSTKTDAKTGADGKTSEKKSTDPTSSSGTSLSSKGGSTSGD